MSLVCRMCSRANPDDAYYCYFDGAALAGRASSDGPINLGAQPFPSPFVFPSGIYCANFDQLGMACQQHWKEAVSVLKDGFFAAFFGAIGRPDLASAAKIAAEFPDDNRGLDELLGKLPTQSLDPPRLRVEPTEINLGQLKFGVDGGFGLDLRNQGMRLAFGTVTSNVPWLALKGHASQSFELLDEATLPIQIVGKSLRARLKPQEGRLNVESNAGNVSVTVVVEVPPIPFAEGALAGATSPRQIAERARANPNAVVPLFASGSVARWFADNGLTYPVQGPTAPGTAGVQQFFEALGLAKPPKVEFADKTITLEGKPGETFETQLTVTTQDKKLVYAYATGDHPWIDGNTVKPAGRSCTIQLKVVVPPNPGEKIAAKVTIHANGRQRFTVPLTMIVRGSKTAKHDVGTGEWKAAPTMEMSKPEPDFAIFSPVEREPRLPPIVDEAMEFAVDRPIDRFRANRSRAWLHALPAAVLALVLVGVVVHDYFAAGIVDDVESHDRIALRFDWSKFDKKAGNSLTFGIVDVSGETPKNLTSSEYGHTNSVVVKIDGVGGVFGKQDRGGRPGKPPTSEGKTFRSQWTFRDAIDVTQTVQLIAGDLIEEPPGTFKRYYDTCLVRYKIENRDKNPHDVGLRFLLDTRVGDYDSPLFALPGQPELIGTITDMQGASIPDYVQVLERPDLSNPGAVAQLNLRLGDKHEPPSRVSLTQWPEKGLMYSFDVPTSLDRVKATDRQAGGDAITDSAIVLYWKTETLAPKQSREFGFTYGLGNVGGQSELTILNPGLVVAGGKFSLVALAKEAGDATIELPPGLTLAGDSAATRSFSAPKAGKASMATWTINATTPGRHRIGVTANGVTVHRVVTVRKTSVF